MNKSKGLFGWSTRCTVPIRLLITVTLITFLFGCSLQEDFNYTSNQELIAINSFLHPDSIISIKVFKTAPYPQGNSFNSINHASVKIYENGVSLGEIPYNPEKQAYLLPYYPKENFSYKLIVKVNGHDSLYATTYIPINSTNQACYSPFLKNDSWFNDKIFLNINITKNDPNTISWIGLTSKIFQSSIRLDTFPSFIVDSSATERAFISSIYSTSSALDRFNSILDEGLNSYSFYLRLNPSATIQEYQLDAFSFDTNKFFRYNELQTLPDSLGLYVHVYTASEDFDRYWKTSLLAFLNSNLEADTPNPFAEQVVHYSNITNGTGIFAGYNSQTIEVHKTKCR